MLRIFFNPFENIFFAFFWDSQGFPKDFPGLSLANPCKSKENVFKWIKKYS